jgi:hypothetical protein
VSKWQHLHHISVRPLNIVFAVSCLLAAALPLAATAQGAERIYWANAGGAPAPEISFAQLDGSGGAPLNTLGAPAECCPFGTAIDSAAGRIYWGNEFLPISLALLNGSGGGALNTAGATTSGDSEGVAIDPAAGRVYWSNYGADKISFANLDGSGGGDLDTTGATVDGPQGVAIDPGASRIYWANFGTPAISFANLGGGGGDDLNTAGATLSRPFGVAIDASAATIYWANAEANKISFARLDGSGGRDLDTSGATVVFPVGVAIDPEEGRIYWANYNADRISFARLDGSGGEDIVTAGANPAAPNSPSLMEAPRAAGAPELVGSAAPRSTLSCSQGTWAPDLIASFLYRAPEDIGYEWTRNGAVIAGADQSSFSPGAVGIYRCRVIASDAAGSSSQVSALHAIFRLGAVRRNKRRGTAKLIVQLPGAGTITLAGRGIAAPRAKRRAESSVTRRVGSAGAIALLIRAKGKKARKLSKTGQVSLRARLTYVPTGGLPGTQTKALKLIKRRRSRQR